MGMSVIRSKDGTQLDWNQTGKRMLDIFKTAPKDKNIFNDFELMDFRESILRQWRQNYYQHGNYYPYNYNYMPNFGGMENNY
jgi:hypothetical protein